MEAPEKIWINPTLDLPKLNGVLDKDSVEYTRIDAFIEKACDWIKEFIQRENDYLVSDAYIFSQIKEFRKAMEG